MNEVHFKYLRTRDQAGLDAERHPAEGVHVKLDFSGADLSDWDLSGLELGDALFHGTDLRRAKLTGTGLLMAEFDGADCRAAKFCDSYLIHASFSNANLRNANFTGASLIGSGFWDCDLTYVTFTRAALSEPNGGNDDVRFKNCVTKGACFDETVLDESVWGPALLDLWNGADQMRQLDFVLRVAKDRFAKSRSERRKDETLRLPENVLGGDEFIAKDVAKLGNEAPVNPFSAAWATEVLTGQDLLRVLGSLVPVAFEG